MARVGRQSDPARKVRPEGSPRLYLLVCTRCWQRPMDCSCEKKATEDRQHVTSPGWQRVQVHTAGDVAAAIKKAGGDPELAEKVTEQLLGDGERRRPTRATERPGSRGEGGRLIA